MYCIRRIVSGLFLLALVVWIAGTTAAQTAPDYYLLPHKGGVGVRQQLEMEVMEPRSTNFPPLGGPILRYRVVWSSSDSGVAIVNQRGKVTGIHEGTVTITAKLVGGPNLTLQSTVTVGAYVGKLIGPRLLSIPHYCARPITVEPLDLAGHPLKDRPVIWLSGAPQSTSIQPWLPSTPPRPPATEAAWAAADTLFFHRTATVSGSQVGQVGITASSEGIAKGILVSVVPSEASTLRMYPDSLLLDVQRTETVLVMARNQEGCTVTDLLVNWATADPTVATVVAVNPHIGEVRGLKAGTTKLTATTPNGVIASIDVTIPAVSFITLDPYQISDLDIGEERTITATPFSSLGNSLHNRLLTWSRSNNNITIDPTSGYKTTVTGRIPGDATVKAASEGISSLASVTVPRVSSISIAPPSADVSLNSTVQLRATPLSSHGKVLANRAITWKVSNNNISVQPDSGYTTTVKGRVPGDAKVTATSEGAVSNDSTIQVQDYCETNLCAPFYVIENYSSDDVDVYQNECNSSSCSGYRPMGRVEAGAVSGPSPDLVENNIYQVRAVKAGCPPDLANCVKLDTFPFVGGPGIYNEIRIF